MDGIDGEIARAVESVGHRVDGCPKRMVYGPCGGVRADDRCELDDRHCPFVERQTVRWIGPDLAASTGDRAGLFGRHDSGPVIVTDLGVRPYDVSSIHGVASRLAGSGDAVLVSDHQDRPDYPPTLMASLVAEAGARPWVTLTCRDRNRVVLESELSGLHALGVLGVHCVTGDVRAPTVRPDASQVFDLDSTRLVALARQGGLATSVAATPTAPPRQRRAERLGEKVRAGAQVCFVNHAGGSAAVARFVDDVRAAGIDVGLVPCVAVFTDVESLVVLERFPGIVIDEESRRAVLTADDARAAGIAVAAAEAHRMLAIDGVIGVNLSGAATSGSELDGAAIMAEVAETIRAGVAAPR